MHLLYIGLSWITNNTQNIPNWKRSAEYSRLLRHKKLIDHQRYITCHTANSNKNTQKGLTSFTTSRTVIYTCTTAIDTTPNIPTIS